MDGSIAYLLIIIGIDIKLISHDQNSLPCSLEGLNYYIDMINLSSCTENPMLRHSRHRQYE